MGKDCECPPLGGKFDINYGDGTTGHVTIGMGVLLSINPGTPHAQTGRLTAVEGTLCAWTYEVKGGNSGHILCINGVWTWQDTGGPNPRRRGTLTPST